MITLPTDGAPIRPTGGATALLGTDANAFFILGRTDRLLRDAGASDEYRGAVRTEATSGDYDHLLATCMQALDAAPIDDEGTEEDDE